MLSIYIPKWNVFIHKWICGLAWVLTLNGLICLADMRFLKWLKGVGIQGFLCYVPENSASHLNLCSSLIFLFSCIVKNLQPLRPLLMRIIEYLTQRVQEYLSPGKLYRTSKDKTEDCLLESWVKGCWLNSKGIHRTIRQCLVQLKGLGCACFGVHGNHKTTG